MFKISEVIHVFKTLTPITSACLNSATKHYQRQRQSQRQECTSSASIRTNFWACCCPWILMCTSCTLLCACFWVASEHFHYSTLWLQWISGCGSFQAFFQKTFPELWVLEGCTELHFWILKHFWSQGCATGCPSIFCADLLLEIKLVIFSQYEHHILTDPRNAQGPCQGFILTQGLSHPSPICMCYASASHAAYTWIANFSGMCVCSDGKFVCKRKPLFHLEQNSREGHCRTKQACYIETNISNK